MTRPSTVFVLLLLTSCGGSGSRADGAGSSGDGRDLKDGRRGEQSGGKSSVGGPCARDEDCADPPSGQCFTTIGGGMAPTITFPGGYCSAGCGDDAGPGCGKSGGCTTVGSSGGMGSVTLSMCTKPCTKPEECRTTEGYTCRIILFGFGYCAPP